jgi:hypothetical protein
LPTVALARSDPGPVVVRRVNERLEIDDEGISLLAAAHMTPGCKATVVKVVDGTVTIDTETGQHTLPRRVSENLFVSTT